MLSIAVIFLLLIFQKLFLSSLLNLTPCLSNSVLTMWYASRLAVYLQPRFHNVNGRSRLLWRGEWLWLKIELKIKPHKRAKEPSCIASGQLAKWGLTWLHRWVCSHSKRWKTLFKNIGLIWAETKIKMMEIPQKLNIIRTWREKWRQDEHLNLIPSFSSGGGSKQKL